MAFTESPTFSYNNGQLWFGDAVAGGMPTSLNTDIAEIDSFSITLSPEYIEHQSKNGSVRLKTLKVMVGCGATGKFSTGQAGAALLKKWLYASQTTIAGGSISATAVPKNPVAVNDIVPAASGKTKLSSVVVTDSAGLPVTGTLGTDYELDADAGLIKVLSISNLTTQPWKIAATEAAATANNLFQTTTPLQGLRFKGNNLANNGAIEIFDIPKIMISPAGDWNLLGDGNEPTKFEWDFEILADQSNLVYPFGRHKI
jgi:hypothetical protein